MKMKGNPLVSLIAFSVIWIWIADSVNAQNRQPNNLDYFYANCYWIYNPANGHYYAEIYDRGFIWENANPYAQKLGGYVVSINDAEEDEWIHQQFSFIHLGEIRIGLYRENGVWKWASGEPVNYKNWNRKGWSGNSAVLYLFRANGWFERPNQDSLSIIVEREHRHADAPPPPEFLQLPPGYSWRYNKDNRHYYTIIKKNTTWRESWINARSIGGYLATINTKEENDFIHNLLLTFNVSDCWIGLKFDQKWYWDMEGPLSYSGWSIDDTTYLYNGEFVVHTQITNGQMTWINSTEDNPDVQGSIVELAPFDSIPGIPTENWSSLNGETMEENSLECDAPSGYAMGNIQFGPIPTGNATDGMGMEITLTPGQGVWTISKHVFDTASLAKISASIRASRRDASIALIALNHPIDGQLGYSKIEQNEIPVDRYDRMHLFYEPPSKQMQIAILAVNPRYSPFNVTVWVDNLFASPYALEDTNEWSQIPLEVDGSFDRGIEKLITNVNFDDGLILPFYQSMSDVAIHLMLNPSQTAANIGTTCLLANDSFPLELMGQVSVQRDSLPGGGLIGFLVTNGFQNLGLFRLADSIADSNAGEEILRIGGYFQNHNSELPLSAFIQLGGPGADASVVVDDLLIKRK